MSEVLGRRYAPERMADERFGSRPDLLVVDGGKPQLTAAIKQLEALGLDIPVCGLAKADEEVFVPWDETPVVLPTGSASLYLIKQVRDESHRFAITFHRELRDKAMTVSVLDDVPGVDVYKRQLSMPRASVDTSRVFRAMRASSWARWTNPTWIQSTAFRRRCRSTKRRRLKTLARRLAL